MIHEVNSRLRGHRFYPTTQELATYPKIYEQDGKGMDAIVHVHYFSAVGDWWITEFDRDDFETTREAFGYVRLAGHPDGAELGYINVQELEELVIRRGFPVWIERDLHWTPKPLREAIAPPKPDKPDQWVYRYSWPASDADPYGKQTVHEVAADNQAEAEMYANLWRQQQTAMGLKADAEAVNLAAVK